MEVKLTECQMSDIECGNKLVVDNDVWEFVNESETDIDDNGKYNDIIYKQPSTGKFFRITLFYCRYGYEDYGYESYMQCNKAIEVEKKEVVHVEWCTVK